MQLSSSLQQLQTPRTQSIFWIITQSWHTPASLVPAAQQNTHLTVPCTVPIPENKPNECCVPASRSTVGSTTTWSCFSVEVVPLIQCLSKIAELSRVYSREDFFFMPRLNPEHVFTARFYFHGDLGMLIRPPNGHGYSSYLLQEPDL